MLAIVKSKDNASYILTEGRKRLMSFGRGETDKAKLDSCIALLDKALEQRPQWHELHITYGQLLLVLGQDVKLALQHFDDALKYGPAKSNAVSLQVKLLAEQGLYRQALDRMVLLRKEVRGQLLGKAEANVLLNNGQMEAAFEAAEKLAASQTGNAGTQRWVSEIAQRVGKLDSAITALRASLQLNPSDPDSWIRLVGLHIQLKQFKEVENVVREAHLACDAEYLPMLTGKYLELLSRWQNAEAIYLGKLRWTDR